jgi:hypothetical protein
MLIDCHDLYAFKRWEESTSMAIVFVSRRVWFFVVCCSPRSLFLLSRFSPSPGSAIVYLTPEERPYVDLIQNLNVPISLRPVNEDAFEAHHSWKTDPDIAELVKAMEEGKTSQAIEAVKKKQQKAAQADKKSIKEEPKDATASSSDSLPPSSIRSVLKEVKYLALEDRALMEKGQKAYTSFIDGYKQHVMTHALNYVKLPFGEVALGMGLLFLPKMPDIKHLTAMIRYDRAPIKAHFIRFKDPKLQIEHDKKEALIHEKNQQEQLSVIAFVC